jgi:hypothetical protein
MHLSLPGLPEACICGQESLLEGLRRAAAAVCDWALAAACTDSVSSDPSTPQCNRSHDKLARKLRSCVRSHLVPPVPVKHSGQGYVCVPAQALHHNLPILVAFTGA